MSQRNKTYTTEELATELEAMDKQIIHGSDIFQQAACNLRQLEQDKARLDWLSKINGKIHVACSTSPQMAQFVDIELTGKDVVSGPTVRRTIDRAMANRTQSHDPNRPTTSLAWLRAFRIKT